MKNKKTNVKQIMAIVALVALVVFVIIMCICMAVGSKELMMASLFCLIFVPIIAYIAIWLYDRTHPEGSVSLKDVDQLEDVTEFVKDEEE